MTGVDYVEARDLIGRPLHVVQAPMYSLLMALRDATGAERSETPEAWCRVIRTHLTRRDYEVLAPLATPRPALVPSAVTPMPGPAGQPLKDAFEQMVAAGDDLVGEIDECMASAHAGDWREPDRDPQRWIRDLVLAMTRAWRGFAPIWQAGREQLAAELERVTAAAERRAHLHVLGDLIPYGHVTGDRWVLEGFGDEDTRLSVPDRGLTLVPLVAGSRASILDEDSRAIKLVGYPLRPVVRLAPRNGHRHDAPLEALVGIPRARILRTLDVPATNNRLAAVLQTVPSAATHHVTALVSAGLVQRDRSGGSLLVRRTARGDALLALYERE